MCGVVGWGRCVIGRAMPACSEVDSETLGGFIRQRRRALGWEQLDLAVAAEMDQANVSKIETGRTSPDKLTLAVYNRLAAALGVPLVALLRAANLASAEGVSYPPTVRPVLDELLSRPGAEGRLRRAGYQPERVAAAIDAVLQVVVPDDE